MVPRMRKIEAVTCPSTGYRRANSRFGILSESYKNPTKVLKLNFGKVLNYKY